MGKCVVHPMGQSAAMEEAVRKLMDGYVFVDGEEYRRHAEAELYTEFRAIVGRVSNLAGYPRADFANNKILYHIRVSTPDGTKIVGLNFNSDSTKNAFMLNLETGNIYEVAMPGTKNDNMQIIYLDNECMLVQSNYSTAYLLDFRFTDSSLWLEEKKGISNAEFSDGYFNYSVHQLQCSALNPGSDREPEAHFVTANNQYARLTKFTYRKADHVLTMEAGDMSSSGIDRDWAYFGRAVDRDTILIMARKNSIGGATHATTKVLLYSYSENRMKAVLSPATVYYDAGYETGQEKIIRSGPDRFLLCGWFVKNGNSMSLCEVRVSGGTVEQLRILDGSLRLIFENVYQDGDVLWISNDSYRTLDDLGTLKKSNRFVCAAQDMDLSGTGELRFHYAYPAVPSRLAGGKLVFDGLTGALFLAKSKKLMTSLRKTL